MPKSTTPRSWRRLPTLAVLPAVMLSLAACGDDSPTFPSSGPIESISIAMIPAGAPTLLVLNPVTGDGPESRRLLGVPQDPNAMWVDAPVEWSSSDPSVATVTPIAGTQNEATLQSVGVGTVTITATSGGATTTRTYTVREFPAVAEVRLAGPGAYLRGTAGDVIQITATTVEIGGIEIPPGPIVWSSSNESIATVDQDGVVTFHEGEGTATISAHETVDDVTGTISVHRHPTLVSGVTAVLPVELAPAGMFEFSIRIPAGTTSFTVETWGGTGGGDADLYLGSPTFQFVAWTGGLTHGSTNDGNEELITVNNPAAGTWRVHIYNWPGMEAPLSDLNVRYTLNP